MSDPRSPAAAIRRALTAMTTELTTTNPDEAIANPGRIALAQHATTGEPAGTFDLVLLITAFVQLPMSRREYAAELQRTLDEHRRLTAQDPGIRGSA
ncbi:hypothetical protein ACJWDR_28970 [Streptomyces tauricus]|uniref:hypothetical protein n=1 Tax=Streptomyces tauricus TaxID=68274 RepID=UPI00387EEFEE